VDTSETFVTGLAILPDAIAAEAAAHDLDEVGRRWLKMPIAADPTSPAHGGGDGVGCFALFHSIS